VRADWIHAHYLSSHGTLAWAATRFMGVPGRMVGSAWGSDILVTPQRSLLMHWLTRRVLRACALATSDSRVMAERMRELGAGEVMTFPFGLETLPPLPAPEHKQPHLFFANRALESIYAPQQVLRRLPASRPIGPMRVGGGQRRLAAAGAEAAGGRGRTAGPRALRRPLDAITQARTTPLPAGT